jgi:hypothetical protein
MRDILTPMNYRRGFQRIYFVLALAWMVTVAVLAWQRDPFYPNGSRKAAHSDSEVIQYLNLTGVIDDQKAQLINELLRRRDSGDMTQEDKARVDYFMRHLLQGDIHPLKGLIGVVEAALITLAGYLVLFWLVPWVLRGFKTGEQEKTV